MSADTVIVKVGDDEAYERALELVAKGPVNVSGKWVSKFHLTDFDSTAELIADVVATEGQALVEADQIE